MENRIAVQIDFYATIQRVFDTQSRRIEVAPDTTVQQLLSEICHTERQRERIFQTPDTVRSDVTILRNGRNINFLKGLNTQLRNEDKIAIFPPVAGG